MSRTITHRPTRNRLLWRIEEHDGRQVRRTLLDPDTGETLDDAWIGADGCVRSYPVAERLHKRHDRGRWRRALDRVRAAVLKIAALPKTPRRRANAPGPA